MSWKIYELKESSAKLEQFSVETGVDCIKNSKTMTNKRLNIVYQQGIIGI